MVCPLTRRLLAAALMLGESLGFAAPARAAETEAIRIDYRAEASCPGADQFVADVLRRAPRARIAAAGEKARTFSITIDRTRAGFEGSLAVQGDASSTNARTVTGARCSEVAEVLALSTAIAVDPSAAGETRPTPGGAGAGTGEPSGSAPDAASKSPDSAPSSSEARTEARPSSRSQQRAEPEDEPEERDEAATYTPPSYDYSARPSGASILIGPELHTGVGPSLARGVVLGIDAAAMSPGAWLSSIGVEFGYLALSTSRVGGAASSFELYLARPRLCGPRLRASRISLGACVGAELGLLSASGSEIAFPESQNRFWAGAAVLVRLQVDLSPTWLVEVAGGPVFAITQDEFVFQDPDTEIYSVPLLGFAGGLRIGGRL